MLVVLEPDGVARAEAAALVVARGRRDGADAAGRRAPRAGARRSARPSRRGSCSTRQASPACGQRDSTTVDLLLRQLGGAVRGHDHVAAVGQHDHLVRRDRVDAGEHLEGARVERRAALDDVRAELLVEAAHAVARRDRDDAAQRRRRPARRDRCGRRQAAPRAAPAARACRRRRAARPSRRPRTAPPRCSGSSVCTCTRIARPVADDQHGVAELLEARHVGARRARGRGRRRRSWCSSGSATRPRGRARAGAAARRGAATSAARRPRRAVPATMPGDQQRRPRSRRRRRRRARAAPAAARGCARPTPRPPRAPSPAPPRARASCSASVASGPSRGLLHVRQLGRDAQRHLAHDRDHRALGRVADRGVGGVGGARERGRDEHRVDQLARAGSRAPRRRRARPGRGSRRCCRARRAARRARRPATISSRPMSSTPLAVEAVELVDHGAQRLHHVVPGVAVGDREDVEVVDLLAACLELGAGRRRRPCENGLWRDRPREPMRQARPWRRTARARPLGAPLADLAGLQAARADVDAAGVRRRRSAPSEVRVEAPLARDHRVAAAVAERRAALRRIESEHDLPPDAADVFAASRQATLGRDPATGCHAVQRT